MSPKPNSLLRQSQPLNKMGSFFQGSFAGLSTGGGNCTECDFKHQCFYAALITLFPTDSKTRNEPDNALSPNQGCHATTPPPTPLPTPVKVNRLAIYLTGYENKLQKHLIDGFTFGFRLHYQGPYKASCTKNLISAMQHPEVVDSKLIKERQSGCILGPFNYPPFSNLRVSPLGVIPKKAPGEFRMIHIYPFLMEIQSIHPFHQNFPQ